MHETCEELVQNLKEYAEWARANEYEVPIMLADDLELAAAIIEGEFILNCLKNLIILNTLKLMKVFYEV